MSGPAGASGSGLGDGTAEGEGDGEAEGDGVGDAEGDGDGDADGEGEGDADATGEATGVPADGNDDAAGDAGVAGAADGAALGCVVAAGRDDGATEGAPTGSSFPAAPGAVLGFWVAVGLAAVLGFALTCGATGGGADGTVTTGASDGATDAAGGATDGGALLGAAVGGAAEGGALLGAAFGGTLLGGAVRGAVDAGALLGAVVGGATDGGALLAAADGATVRRCTAVGSGSDFGATEGAGVGSPAGWALACADGAAAKSHPVGTLASSVPDAARATCNPGSSGFSKVTTKAIATAARVRSIIILLPSNWHQRTRPGPPKPAMARLYSGKRRPEQYGGKSPSPARSTDPQDGLPNGLPHFLVCTIRQDGAFSSPPSTNSPIGGQATCRDSQYRRTETGNQKARSRPAPARTGTDGLRSRPIAHY